MSKLLALALVLLISVGTLAGSTIAWFTDSVTSTGNQIKAGTLDVKLYSKNNATDAYAEIESGTKAIYNYDKWEPGYTDLRYFKIVNNGSLAFKFKLNLVPDVEAAEGEVNLADVIEVYVGESTAPTNSAELHNFAAKGVISELAVDADGMAYGVLLPKAGKGSEDVTVPEGVTYPEGEIEMWVALHMKEEAGNEYQNKSVGEGFAVELMATQFTYENDSFDHKYDEEAEYKSALPDKWDGGVDPNWPPVDPDDPDTDEYIIYTAEELAAFAKLVDEGNTFEGKTVKLGRDIDLYHMADGATEPKSFNPIGYGYDVVFKGTFDGQSHTISNLYQNGWALGYDYSTEGGGLFASVVGATIKNLNIDNAEIVMECIDMGIVVGYSYGNCTYENITVSNSIIANYQRYTGGVVGEVNGTQTFKNVDVKDTVVSSLWGDFDCSLGGIIGGKYGNATVTMEDCDVEAELNAYNDVTSSYQWYAYRRAGMLIGNSEETKTVDGRTEATASYLTAKNCTVTYGDWANYTYCEFAGTSWPYVRVQAGYSSDAYSNPRYGVATDANGNKAVDDTHVHNDGEDHNILLTFDQLYGGGQGVYGGSAHYGVTVVYNK